MPSPATARAAIATWSISPPATSFAARAASPSPAGNVFGGRGGIACARRFVKATGVQAVIGYATPVGWMASLVCDLLFLHRFYTDPAPWKNLRRIFKSVHRDYPAARRLKHLLITRKDVR